MLPLLVVCILGTVYASESGSGMPPFVILSPTSLRAGHTGKLQFLLFNNEGGNLTVRYFNVTKTWYPEYSYREDILVDKTFDISADTSSVELSIEIPGSVVGSHKIQVSGYFEGYGKLKSYNTSVYPSSSGYKTYVQTDKPLYKPGQPVRFRAFTVDSDLKAISEKDGIKVTINTPSGVKIYQETIKPEEIMRPIQGTFLLAEEAQIGTYNIYVNGKGSASCQFSVEEYVLPKFGLEISGPGHIKTDDTVIKGSVSATYTYGKPVDGKVTLKFAVDNTRQQLYSGAYYFHEMTTDLKEGKADWEIDISSIVQSKLKYLFNPWCTPSNLIIYAKVVDEARGFEVEDSDSSTKFVQSSLKLTFNKNTQKNYAAGFPFYVELDVEGFGGTETTNLPVKLTLISGLSDLTYTTKEAKIKDGKVFATFDIPENACAVKVTAEFDSSSACESVFACYQPERLVSHSDKFIKFQKTEPIAYSGGDEASYTVVSNIEVEALHFFILYKGTIYKSWNVNPSWGDVENKKIKSFKGTFEIPKGVHVRSRLVVLSANSANGYIVADAIDLCIKESMAHNLNMNFSKDSGKPGDAISVTVESDAKSFIGISVVDSSLNLLKQPCKVLTKESSMDFLRRLDLGTSKDLTCKKDDPYQCTSSTKVKIIDTKDLLRAEGLDIKSNMNLFDYSYVQPQPKYSPYYKNDYLSRSGPTYASMSIMESSGMAYGEAAAEDVEADDGEEPAPEEEGPRLRNVFPESWLWTDEVADENGKLQIKVTAPDTITGWIGSAFGLSPNSGLGFSNEVEFKTFLPFFVSLDVPYSGTVGETITIPIRLFNYLDKDVNVKVKISSEIGITKSEEIKVESNKAVTVDYEVALIKAGNHDITVEAKTSTGDADAIKKSLFVKPGGEKIVESTSVLIMKNERKSSSKNKEVVTIALPRNHIPGSHSLKLVAVGDILGEAVSGISNLIQLPSGCGEQNMHKVAINVFAAQYLRTLSKDGSLQENILYNIKHNLNIGLQQQMAYRKGSSYSSVGYSIFVGGDSSDWLTAFVYKVLSQFPEDIYVPCDTINADKNSLFNKVGYASRGETSKNASRNGWAPYQYSYHKLSTVYWNSYYLISLLESGSTDVCGKTIPEYSKNKLLMVCNATYEQYIEVGDCCYHHMVSYALHLCEKTLGFMVKEGAYKFDSSTCLKTSQNKRYMYVDCGVKQDEGSSRAIEATAYAALYYMSIDMVDDALPMVMWLASQRTENGGFRSSQDTVMGLQALSKFAAMIQAKSSAKTDLSLMFGKGRKYESEIKITDEDKLAVKEVIISNPSVGKYRLIWNGVGTAFAQVISSYHVTDAKYKAIYQLKAKLDLRDGYETLHVKFILPKGTSTMYLVDLSAVTGSVFTKSLIEGVRQETNNLFDYITRYDIKEGGQRLQLYIDPMIKTSEVSFSLPLGTKYKVKGRQPAQVTVVDYYDPSKRETVFYNVDEESNEEEQGCTLSLSCDELQSAEAILIGKPSTTLETYFAVKEATAYKNCKDESIVTLTSANIKYSDNINRRCIGSIKNKKSIFLLHFAGNDVEVVGVADYSALRGFIAECGSEVKECPKQ